MPTLVRYPCQCDSESPCVQTDCVDSLGGEGWDMGASTEAAPGCDGPAARKEGEAKKAPPSTPPPYCQQRRLLGSQSKAQSSPSKPVVSTVELKDYIPTFQISRTAALNKREEDFQHAGLRFSKKVWVSSTLGG